MFSYYITTHFIPSNKDYNSYRNLHSVYQTYPRFYVTYYLYRYDVLFFLLDNNAY